MNSYPTPDGAAKVEIMNSGFLKLHPGPPIHYFTECRDEEYHTHPAEFETHIIQGGYREEVLESQLDGTYKVRTFDRLPGTSHRMPVGVPHKLTGLVDGPCITRCEFGPARIKPGFCKFVDGVLLHRYHDEDFWTPYNR